MIVDYYSRIPGGYGNLIWRGRWPMRGGRFPADHPAKLEGIQKLRDRGWPFVSCFPEGDGITFDPPATHTHDQIVEDVRECLGFELRIVRR